MRMFSIDVVCPTLLPSESSEICHRTTVPEKPMPCTQCVLAFSDSEETVSGQPHPEWNQRVYADAARWVFIAR